MMEKLVICGAIVIVFFGVILAIGADRRDDRAREAFIESATFSVLLTPSR